MEDSKNLCKSSLSINEHEDCQVCEDSQLLHVRCEPVIDILSAKVVIDSSFDFYGCITIQDLKGSNKYNVYESPKSIYPSWKKTRMPNFLPLSGPKEIPSSLDEHLLRVDIWDKKSDRALFCGEKRLIKTTNSLNKFEMIDTLQFQETEGSGHLEVKYVAFTFGVYARVQIFLCKDDDDDKKGVEVFGMICVKCNHLILHKECYDNHMFNMIEYDHVWVGLGTEIVLSKDLVAVPAYSQLEISVDLMGNDDTGFIVEGSACFEPSNYRGGRKEIRGVNGYYLNVQVEWYKPSLLNEPCSDRWHDKVACNVMVPLSKHPMMPKQPMIYASQILEVFSLFIARSNDEDVRLYGSVKVLDSMGSCEIFTCSKDEPCFLARGCNLLPLQGPNRAMIPGRFFCIDIDLRDIGGLVKIKGYIDSSAGINQLQRPWFDRRLCSVVRGDRANKRSFVAVNYTFFPFAVVAILTVRLVSCIKSAAHVKIYGKITFSYGMLSYSTEYDSKFFQRVVFTRNEAKSLEIENLELSRCVVAVPMTSYLSTHVDLSFQSIDPPRRIVGTVTFDIGDLNKVIKEGLVDICIDVEWKGHHLGGGDC